MTRPSPPGGSTRSHSHIHRALLHDEAAQSVDQFMRAKCSDVIFVQMGQEYASILDAYLGQECPEHLAWSESPSHFARLVEGASEHSFQRSRNVKEYDLQLRDELDHLERNSMTSPSQIVLQVPLLAAHMLFVVRICVEHEHHGLSMNQKVFPGNRACGIMPIRALDGILTRRGQVGEKLLDELLIEFPFDHDMYRHLEPPNG